MRKTEQRIEKEGIRQKKTGGGRGLPLKSKNKEKNVKIESENRKR